MRLNSDGKILVNQALPFDTNMLCIKGIVPYNGGPAAPASGISSGILWLEAYDGDHGLEIGAYNTGGGSWINIQSRHRNSSTAQPLNINQKGGRVGIGKMNTPSYELDVSGTMRVTEGFGCNGKTPQTEYTVSGVITGVADGTYSSVEQNLINSGIALLNGIRAALIANGICV
jgi:hypothetical protein